MKTICIYICAVILFSSCLKSHKNVQVEGRLMKNCNTPASNTKAYIMWHDRPFALPGAGGTGGYNLWAEITTDNNGYFKVTKQSEWGDTLKIVVDKSAYVNRVQNLTVLDKIRPGKKNHINLGNVYTHSIQTDFTIKLDVRNPYTENDTLVIFNYTDYEMGQLPLPLMYIPGPFFSGVFGTATNYNYIGRFYSNFPLNYNDVTENKTLIASYAYSIRSLPAYNKKFPNAKFNIAPICSRNFAEVTLVIE
jgi:hypothetical protein